MSTLCPQCQAENPEDKKCCGDCGAFLDPHIGPLYKYVNDFTRQQVRQEVQERFRDQTLVEIETSQAIATRLGNWAKLFAYFVGIPFAMFIVVLSIFGVRSFTDFLTMVETAQSNISAKLEAVENATLQADELLTQTDRLKGQVEEVERLAADMEQMRAQPKEIGESLQEDCCA